MRGQIVFSTLECILVRVTASLDDEVGNEAFVHIAKMRLLIGNVNVVGSRASSVIQVLINDYPPLRSIAVFQGVDSIFRSSKNHHIANVFGSIPRKRDRGKMHVDIVSACTIVQVHRARAVATDDSSILANGRVAIHGLDIPGGKGYIANNTTIGETFSSEVQPQIHTARTCTAVQVSAVYREIPVTEIGSSVINPTIEG